MPEYRLHEFNVTPRPLPDPWGGVVPTDQYPFRSGATLRQWANIELAQAHVAAAIKMLAEMDPELDATPNFSDIRVNRNQCRRQFGFLVQLSKHISRAYNALGILWYNDPNHRVIYRKYFSGAPVAVRGDFLEVFMKSKNWGGLMRWYQKSERYPRVPVNAEGMGILPRETRDLLTRFGKDSVGNRSTKNVIEFVQQMSFVITPQDNAVNDGTVRNVYNAGSIKNETRFSWTQDLYECANIMGEPWSTEDQANEDQRCGALDFVGTQRRVMSVDVGGMKAGTVAPDPFNDWRCFAHHVNLNIANQTVPLKSAPPLRSYLPYLAEVAESLNARHPYETIQDSRALPIWNNVKTVAANGGLQDTVSSAINTQASIASEQAAGSPELRAASQMTTALTTAVGPAIPFPGNIITMIIGGAASLVMTALNGTVIKGRISSHGRDDLGRYKIILDPQVLYPNVEATEAPVLPDSAESVPTGFSESPQSAASMTEMLRYRDFQAFKSWRDNKYAITEEMSRKALQNAIAFAPNRRILRDNEEDNTTLYLLGAAAAAIAVYAFTKGPVPPNPMTPKTEENRPTNRPARRTPRRKQRKGI